MYIIHTTLQSNQPAKHWSVDVCDLREHVFLVYAGLFKHKYQSSLTVPFRHFEKCGLVILSEFRTNCYLYDIKQTCFTVQKKGFTVSLL